MCTVHSNLFVCLLLLFICTLTGCEPKLDSKNWKEREAAVKKLTDQAVLAKVALEEENWVVRKAAIEKLTDQAALTQVAMSTQGSSFRKQAVQKLTDQATLARIALEDEDYLVIEAAVEKLTDETMLAEVALEKGLPFCKAAVKKLTNPLLLERVGGMNLDPIRQAKTIAAMSESDPAIKRLAGHNPRDIVSRDGRVVIARMKLALQEPRIKSHFPRLRCSANVISKEGPRYTLQGFPDKWYIGGGLPGEIVSIKLHQNGTTITEGSWSTYFPETISSSQGFLRAAVFGEDLLIKLLSRHVFTQDDLVDLSNSGIAELRIAAAANLNDQTILATIAIEGKTRQTSEAAIQKLNDQLLLAKIANAEDKDIGIRRAAKDRIRHLDRKK